MSARDQNIERVKHWEWTFNNDVMRMVDECYAEDCEVTDMYRGRVLKGREELRLMEQQMLDFDPTRQMKIIKSVIDDESAALELEAHWNNSEKIQLIVVFLTFNEDGLIQIDHSYSGEGVEAAENDPRSG